MCQNHVIKNLDELNLRFCHCGVVQLSLGALSLRLTPKVTSELSSFLGEFCQKLEKAQTKRGFKILKNESSFL